MLNYPNQPLEQALQFSGQPDFPNNHCQPFPENSGMYTNQARSTFKVKNLGMYSQYNLASGELKYTFSSHLPKPVGRPATSSIVSPREFVSPSELLGLNFFFFPEFMLSTCFFCLSVPRYYTVSLALKLYAKF